MQLHIGTKLINAIAMTLGDYNKLQGWTLPEGQDATAEGYLVEYLDGGKPNHPDYDNYISWSPRDVFKDSYKVSGDLSFGDAVLLMKNGYVVSRTGWNGKGMWLRLITSDGYTVSTDVVYDDTGEAVKLDPWVGMKTAGDSFVPWLASQADVLAGDWCIV